MGVLAGSVAGLVLARDVVVDPSLAGAATGRAKAPADGVVTLGNAYLRSHPDEADKKFLLAHLPGIDASAPVRPQLPALALAITKDFEAGRVVSLQGWQLSRTEGRAAAAVALGA